MQHQEAVAIGADGSVEELGGAADVDLSGSLGDGGEGEDHDIWSDVDEHGYLGAMHDHDYKYHDHVDGHEGEHYVPGPGGDGEHDQDHG